MNNKAVLRAINEIQEIMDYGLSPDWVYPFVRMDTIYARATPQQRTALRAPIAKLRLLGITVYGWPDHE